MVKISALYARKIINSRGNWTIEVFVRLSDGSEGVGRAPGGKSKGKKESVTVDADAALKSLKFLWSELRDFEFHSPEELDEKILEICGKNKEKCGANLTIALSIAVWRAFGLSTSLGNYFKPEFPIPMFNVVNGGVHAGVDYSIQEFLVVPVGIKNFEERIEAGVGIYNKLKEIFANKYGKRSLNLGDEGGLTPSAASSREVLENLEDAISGLGFSRQEVAISLDVAANSFFQDGLYSFDNTSNGEKEYFEEITSILSDFKIFSVEDPFPEEKPELFGRLKNLGLSLVVGDDLTVTDAERIEKYGSMIDGVIIKPDQRGTVTEAIEAIITARKNGKFCIASHRSGETEDPFIAEFSLFTGTKFLKAGAPARGERTAKYNWLLRYYYVLGEV